MKFKVSFLICLFLPALLIAETVELSGVKFPVQEYKRVDSATIKISVLGSPKIVKAENANQEIVKQFFSSWDKTKSLGIEQITSFCIQSIKDGEISWAVTAFDALALTFADSPDETVLSLEKIIDNTKDYREFLISIISLGSFSQYRANLSASLLLNAAALDINWIIANKSAEINKFSEQIQSYAKSRIPALLKQQQVDLATLLSGALDKFYPESEALNKYLENLFKVFFSPILKIRSLHPNPAEIQLDLQYFRSNSEFNFEDERIFLPFIHTSVENLLAKKDSINALEYLALIDLRNRTPRTHSLALEALKQTESNAFNKFSPELKNFLSGLSANDQEIKKLYYGSLENQFDKYLIENEPQRAETSLNSIVEIRPDPNTENDKLRIALAKLYLKKGLKNPARDQIDKIQTSISLGTRLDFIFSGLYLPVPLLLFLLCLPLFATISYLFNVRKKQRRILEMREREAYARIQDEEERSKLKGFKPSQTQRVDPLLKEYEDLLLEFGLKGKTSLRQLKSAYRKQAKRAHPDKKQTEESSEFLQLKVNYEKLLSLRKKLAID
ncbi:MAG: J domain-containing protein [Bdellovibrionota bacterium]